MTLNGELIPNRIFVGNLPLNVIFFAILIMLNFLFQSQNFNLTIFFQVTDIELIDYFTNLTSSHVKEVKIITDPKGLSKG